MSQGGPTNRFQVRDGAGATLEYVGTRIRVPVRLTDVSSTGAGLLLPEAPRVGSAVVLSLLEGDQTSQVSAVIRWAEPRHDGSWRAGCKFNQPTGPDFSMGTDLIRSSCSISVKLRYQGEPFNQHEAIVVDHSTGGLRLATGHAPAPGTMLMIDPGEEPSQFVARVQWCFTEGGQSFVGCQFTRRSDLVTFRKLLPAMTQPDSSTAPPITQRTRRAAWVGCALVYAWCAIYSSGFWPAS